MWVNLSNLLTLGENHYLKDIASAIDMLAKYKNVATQRGNHHQQHSQNKLTMIQLHSPIHDNIGAQKLLTANGIPLVPETWILLDKGSLIIFISNSTLVDGIRKSTDPITCYTNGGGSMRYDHKAKLKLLPIYVYFNQNGIANIHSMGQLAELANVNVYTTSFDGITVTTTDETTLLFKWSMNKLYCYDTAATKNVVEKENYLMPMMSTVSCNRKYFTKSEVEAADKAINLQERIGWRIFHQILAQR